MFEVINNLILCWKYTVSCVDLSSSVYPFNFSKLSSLLVLGLKTSWNWWVAFPVLYRRVILKFDILLVNFHIKTISSFNSRMKYMFIY